ncbi:hypothetical protein [Haladaptatus sp. NG-SE-30]
MVNGFHVISVTVALQLALVTLLGPLADVLGATNPTWFVGYIGLPGAIAYVLLLQNPALSVDGVWHFGFLVFLLSVGIHLLLGTGLTAGRATSLEIVAVWLFTVCAVAAVFRKTGGEQLRA